MDVNAFTSRLILRVCSLLQTFCTDDDCALRYRCNRIARDETHIDPHTILHEFLDLLKEREERLRRSRNSEGQTEKFSKEEFENDHDDPNNSRERDPPQDEGWGEWFLQLLERVPILGYGVAAWHYFKNGNSDKAKRAMARCTNSSMVSLAALAGFFVGGPLGSALAAGAATPFAILVEASIAQGIQDPTIRRQVGEVTLGRMFLETAFNMLGAGVLSAMPIPIGQLAAEEITKVMALRAMTWSFATTGHKIAFPLSLLSKIMFLQPFLP